MRWTGSRLVVATVTALALSACGADPAEPPAAAGQAKVTPSATTSTADPAAEVEPLLAAALPADKAVGMRRDAKFEAANTARGITAPTVFQCRTAPKSEALRVSRVARAWMTPGWMSGNGRQVYATLELVAYRPGGTKAAVADLAAVPKTCPSLIDANGAERTHEEFPGDVFTRIGAAAVLATLKHDNGTTEYELSVALPGSGRVLGMLMVRGTDSDDLVAAARLLLRQTRVAVSGVTPKVDAALEAASAAA